MRFEFARSDSRHTVLCATGSNILKFSEGLLKRTFEEIAPEYSNIESHHIIIDNSVHQLVRRPKRCAVSVTTNVDGDIISDLSSALVGRVGGAPSANIGNDVAVLEAVPGSAPKYAGKNVGNPTALIRAGVMMLRWLGEVEASEQVEHAALLTRESGVKTQDIAVGGPAASTTECTASTISRTVSAPPIGPGANITRGSYPGSPPTTPWCLPGPARHRGRRLHRVGALPTGAGAQPTSRHRGHRAAAGNQLQPAAPRSIPPAAGPRRIASTTGPVVFSSAI